MCNIPPLSRIRFEIVEMMAFPVPIVDQLVAPPNDGVLVREWRANRQVTRPLGIDVFVDQTLAVEAGMRRQPDQVEHGGSHVDVLSRSPVHARFDPRGTKDDRDAHDLVVQIPGVRESRQKTPARRSRS